VTLPCAAAGGSFSHAELHRDLYHERLCRCRDLEELRSELEDDEYEETRKDTLDQMAVSGMQPLWATPAVPKPNSRARMAHQLLVRAHFAGVRRTASKDA